MLVRREYCLIRDVLARNICLHSVGAEDWGLWMNILKDVDYIYTYPKALWKYRHIPGSETSNKWLMLKAVVKMYKTVLGMNSLEAWFIALFIFLPDNILKKLKK